MIYPELRKDLEECDKCPHMHSFKQEWHVPYECKEGNVKPDDKPLGDDTLMKKSADKPFKPVEWKGHPLVCHCWLKQ